MDRPIYLSFMCIPIGTVVLDTGSSKTLDNLIIIIIIIIIIKGIYRAQDRPKATSALCQQRNCQLFTCQPSTYYQQL